MAILPAQQSLPMSQRHHFLALFFNVIVMLHSTSVLPTQNSSYMFCPSPSVSPAQTDMADPVAFLATCPTSRRLFWRFLIELFGVRPL